MLCCSLRPYKPTATHFEQIARSHMYSVCLRHGSFPLLNCLNGFDSCLHDAAHAEHYGFTLADNPHDQADIPLSAFPDAFTAYLTQQGRSASHCFLHCNGIPSWSLLRDLRCCAAKPAERKQLGHLAVSGQRISVAGDLKVSTDLDNRV